MEENICKQSNWQGINLQNIQAVPTAQYQKRTLYKILKTWKFHFEDLENFSLVRNILTDTQLM